MKTSTALVPHNSPSRRRRAPRTAGHAGLESLEPRTLMSAAWSTELNDPAYMRVTKLAADRFGDVYAMAYTPAVSTVVLEKVSGSARWTPIYTGKQGSGPVAVGGMALDAAGDLFVGGSSSAGGFAVFERPVGQTSFRTIDTLPGTSGLCYALTTDSAGDVFAAGFDSLTTTTTVKNGNKTTTTTSTQYYATIRKLTPSGSGFSGTTLYHAPGPVNDLGGTVFLEDITVIEAGNSAGIYAIGGTNTGPWQAIKSTDGGATWTTIATGQANAGHQLPPQIVADLSGNIYICAGTSTSSTDNWTVRESSDGGATWTVVDAFNYPGSVFTHAYAMGTDLQGNVYVVGQAFVNGSAPHGIIRTNAGGTWTTVDDFQGVQLNLGGYLAFTVDSNGTLYAGGGGSAGTGLIRSTPGPGHG